MIDDCLCKLEVLNSDKWIAKSKVSPSDIRCIRITGHEPSLQWDHIIDLLKELNQRKEFSGFSINMQTNGVEVGRPGSKIDVNELKNLDNLKIRIEISFKGVNPKQFEWLTEMPGELFYYQCNAFDRF